MSRRCLVDVSYLIRYGTCAGHVRDILLFDNNLGGLKTQGSEKEEGKSWMVDGSRLGVDDRDECIVGGGKQVN